MCIDPLSDYNLTGDTSSIGIQVRRTGARRDHRADLYGGSDRGLLKAIDTVPGLRIGAGDEDIGLDITEHKERGYDL